METQRRKIWPVTAQPAFSYQPLDDTRQEVRLVRILHTDNHNHECIALELRHFDLNDLSMPPYTAISYTWGSALLKHRIVLNEKSYSVRSHLHDFLVEARRRKLNGWLWIDQISIAQSNTSERNHQVSILGSIFGDAVSVIAWVGGNDAKRAKLSTIAREILQVTISGNSLMDIDSWLLFGEAFAAEPYWSRLWILQEIVLGKDLQIWWDTNAFVADEWVDVLSLSSRARLLLRLDHDPRSAKRQLPCSLSSLTLELDASKCEDKRDIIYGVQTLLYQESQLQVDYKRSVEEVFDAALAVLAAESYLDDRYNRELAFLDVIFSAAASGLRESMKIKLPKVSLTFAGWTAQEKSHIENYIWHTFHSDLPSTCQLPKPRKKGGLESMADNIAYFTELIAQFWAQVDAETPFDAKRGITSSSRNLARTSQRLHLEKMQSRSGSSNDPE